MSNHLTRRELECVTLAAQGLTDKQIRARLGIGSNRTVSNHLASAYTKLGVSDRRTAASALGIDYSVLPIPISYHAELGATPDVTGGQTTDQGDRPVGQRTTLYEVYAALGQYRIPPRWGGTRIWLILGGAFAAALLVGAILAIGLVVSGVVDVIHDWRIP